MCVGVGSGARFSEVQSSGVCFSQVPEAASGRFRTVPMCAGVGSGGKFQKVPESSGGRYCRFRRQVPESSGVRWCRYRRQGSEGFGELRCGLLLCNLVRGSQRQLCDCFEYLLAITLSTWAEPLRIKK